MLSAIAPKAYAQAQHPGQAVYEKWCAGCHGVDGDGEGVAAGYMLPRPRDFTDALYQIRTTPSGNLPSDADILRVINEGMSGTAMPAWEEKLPESQRLALVDYLKTFSQFFETLPTPETVEIGDAPGVTPEALAEGRGFYQQIECWKCHGQEGRGDGPSAPTLQNDAGLPIRAADLTENWNFNGGGTVRDIYTRLRTGLDGTPMPSFSDLIAAEFMTEEQLWHLAQYVRSLAPETAPEAATVITAGLISGELPDSPDDSVWATVEPAYIPLVGQIIEETRWFSPSVDGVWVKALHNGEDLALRLAWHDPSKSPDPNWLEWQQRVLAAVEPDAGVEPGPRPDQFAVQFPREIPEGRELPYFLMGDADNPVYLWHWTSGESAVESVARGLGSMQPLPADAQALETHAVFDHGEWRLLLRRPLVTVDTTAADASATPRLQFPIGRTVPIAFYAWDGSNGEAGTRAAISSWYYIYLDTPTPNSVYTTPMLAMVLTAGLGLVVVVRAQNREQNDDGHDPDSDPNSNNL